MKITDSMVLFWHGALSNWYMKAPFTVGNVTFNCGEQWMMYAKAKMFGDDATAAEIMLLQKASEQKAAGRRVKNFDPDLWGAHNIEIVAHGLTAKFSQHQDMKDLLLGTGNRIIVEASPVDNIWGIGLDEEDERALDVSQWRGENRLGRALMHVREIIRITG